MISKTRCSCAKVRKVTHLTRVICNPLQLDITELFTCGMDVSVPEASTFFLNLSLLMYFRKVLMCLLTVRDFVYGHHTQVEKDCDNQTSCRKVVIP